MAPGAETWYRPGPTTVAILTGLWAGAFRNVVKYRVVRWEYSKIVGVVIREGYRATIPSRW